MDTGAESYHRFREQGDESGLAEIIRDYKDGLIFYLSGYTGDLHIAEELAEDTFVRLGTRKPKDRGGSSFRTWLYTIGRNIAIDWLRKQKRRGAVSIDEVPEPTDEEADLERACIREERKILVHRALNCLKPEYRQVLWLLYFEGFSTREAASILGKSVHNTETLAYRARQALKEKLKAEGIDSEDL